ncbi:MAG: cytochrome ubiquinol oxidase subunit I [Reyranella sp.]|jgi:cytochrome d ubiquinol oxidase subunit I|uniref:cytochrome ubiquinol oxidase subunit I n=1 Tax=Reyranella sp. TaxID=1929291 RepID=UPI00095E7C30|nr:cytochrome ubiquinol oxidase subunit I [Reyranella sp.]MBN9538004.1 cytochrome ubiquinol oxidase subunit I [Alphaproteobacteria bacterium]MBR2814160.1 cytochrome ubiquinol oxidase subunit I [Reyranella sp.]OJU32551.1 MAG: cytochrome ubiquinol oxidase subunit I [Alphaproteobacteria bacterium 65-37]
MFEAFDAVFLARLQFAFTVSFHFIFPSFSIGLASYLAVLEALWLWTGRAVYLDLFKYWLKIFALTFGMGVVSGIVMSYQFGTNWSVFSDKAGPVVGPLMAYEVLTAFFLEAGFLGVMLFGMNRVGKSLHFVATLAVAVGTFISAFWILSANSWMQTPTGHVISPSGQFVPEDWFAIIFNPSFPYRLVHTVFAAYLTTALVVGGVGAWHLLRERANEGARVMFSMAMGMITVVAPLQIFVGDQHGLNTLEHQPVKVMAMEGHFKNHDHGAPLVLFGWPDEAAGEMKYSIEIPKASSLILKHAWDAPLKGLESVDRKDWPPVPVVFWAFRVMVGLGMLMLALAVYSLVARTRKRLYDWPWLHRFAVAMGPAGFVAVIAGWVTTEVGRQPYTVYGLLRTADSASPLAAPAVGMSLLAFIVVYFIVFGSGVYYILKLMSHSPHSGEEGPARDVPVRAGGITPAPAVSGSIAGGKEA